MSTEKIDHICPGCRGTNLHLGKIDRDNAFFHPSGAAFFSPDYSLLAFACLDCGLVGYRMDAATLEKLRTKTA
ncbi:MAG TPA: hypothetical protein VGY58_11040 [Gemmataceae bacterium]|nr:hypothetical protein [Gemmataceae bacterium]